MTPTVVVKQLDEPVDLDAWVRRAVAIALRAEGVTPGGPRAEVARSMGEDRPSLHARRSS